ncbi:hypothetical protein [Moraxella catarrhalis]|uniref:Uncharacterized protein n=1 Tax=Moraxella catarrhalis TaxID=480 RepID=A0ABY0BM17_MORCA|nr:hypothetical protein [Moraxella catarrhalis]MPX02727.1 hypothetical protein [Moraxella catarrhalis]RUO17063.1 hypothetical protein EJK55_1143 [Moraxella catarrhalis]RUO17562.1 hypothetical protein EJK54_1077 [Moraxella catarrhalis]
MIVREYLDYLANTELKNLNLIDTDTGKIPTNKLSRLMHLLQAGLRELSTRFDLQSENIPYHTKTAGIHSLDLKQAQKHHITSDVLMINHVLCVYAQTDDVLSANDLSHQTLECLSEKAFQEKALKLNLQDTLYQANETIPFYCLVSPTKLQLYSPYDVAHYLINARVVLGVNDALQLTDKLPVPTAYYNALGLYIASVAFRSVNNQLGGDVNESMRYYQAYQQEIMMLEQQGIKRDNQPQTHLFHTKGFI